MAEHRVLFRIGDKTYERLEDIPEQLRRLLVDADRNGVPDALEGTGAVRFRVGDREVRNLRELPEDIQAAIRASLPGHGASVEATGESCGGKACRQRRVVQWLRVLTWLLRLLPFLIAVYWLLQAQARGGRIFWSS